MIAYDVAVVRQVLKTTCTISIWILAFAGPKKWRFPIQYWIFLKKYPSKQQVHIPKKFEEKHQINQINQIKSVYSTFKRMAIVHFQEGGKMKHPDFLFPPFWIISFTGTSSSSITGRTWKACQVWRTTLVFVCKSTWIWFEQCDSHSKPGKNMKGAISFKIWRTCILSKSHKYWGSYVNVIFFFGRILPGYWAFLRHLVSAESFVASP